MEQVLELLERIVSSRTWIQAVLSQPRTKGPEAVSKCTIKPVQLKQGLHYQFAAQAGPKVLHDNVEEQQAAARAAQLVHEQFRQAVFQTSEADYHVLVTKKGKVTILTKPATKKAAEVLTHNRKKQYLLTEGQPVPFLVELGVMTAQGKVVTSKYDKFRQINRFLEMVDDVVQQLPQDRTVRIIDFGCGKSYLTFALYHYLRVERGLEITIVGLDLKQDVIAHCNALAQTLQYDGLTFQVGDIGQYTGADAVDMVVTLHACDTATDAALDKAIRWGARVILSVPCCQHELYRQVKQDVLQPLLKHGILKERFAALVTDAARAQLLEMAGYRTQVLEFIDMEHTPKNLLIRAVKEDRSVPEQTKREQAAQYRAFADHLQIQPCLERLLEPTNDK